MTGEEKRAKIIAQQALREAAAIASSPPRSEKKKPRRNWAATAPIKDRAPHGGPRPPRPPKEDASE
jgi:hypothetical protein